VARRVFHLCQKAPVILHRERDPVVRPRSSTSRLAWIRRYPWLSHPGRAGHRQRTLSAIQCYHRKRKLQSARKAIRSGLAGVVEYVAICIGRWRVTTDEFHLSARASAIINRVMLMAIARKIEKVYPYRVFPMLLEYENIR